MRKHSTSSTRQDLGQALGRAIAVRRKECGYTQDDLAGVIGVDAETISRFERGSVLPSLQRLAQVAGALQVSLSELLGESSTLQGDQMQRMAQIMEALEFSERTFLLDFAELLRQRAK